MRLLYRDRFGTIQFDEFNDASEVKYAILSHRWGKPEEEISFVDIRDHRPLNRKPQALFKLEHALEQAAKQQLKYVWIDTCCIDKSSSAELSEAINSMYYWYEKAERCYAFLADVPSSCPFLTDVTGPSRWDEYFMSSVWFTRGW